MTSLSLFAALGAALLAATPALATETKTVRVAHSDLDLSTREGVRAFDTRIARALDTVCPGSGEITLRVISLEERCRRAAAANVRSQRNAAIAAYRVRRGMDVAAR